MSGLTGHGDRKYTTGSRLATSAGRGWNGLLAERWHHGAGRLADVEPRETEVVVLIDGRLRVRRRGDGRLQDHTAAPGTVWLCPAGIPEDMIRLDGEISESVHIYIPAAPLSASALEEFDIDPAAVRLRYDGGFRDPVIEQIGRAVLAELKEPGPGSGLLMETMGAALGAYLLRHYSNRSAAATPLPRADGALDRRRLHRITEYITGNLQRNLTLEELATEACLSRYHFARAFKAAVGVTPHRFVVEQRVARARDLLGDGDLSLAEIAARCGFSSQAHFTRAFRDATGVTPGAYRAGLH